MTKKKRLIYFVIIIFSTCIFMNNILAENIEIEAEKYDNRGRPKFYPFKILRDSKASKRKYITCLTPIWSLKDDDDDDDNDFDDGKINDRSRGQAHYKFKLKEKGSIDIYVRVDSDNRRRDSFFYNVKGIDKRNDWAKVAGFETKGWMWMNCASYKDIEDGTYTFKIIHGINKIKIDKIFISLDGKKPKGEILDAGSIAKRKKKEEYEDDVELTEEQKKEIEEIGKKYTIIEAGNGDMFGCNIRDGGKGYSGAGYVSFRYDIGAKLDIPVKVRDTKVYKVLIRYANKNNPRPLEISVNKKVVHKRYIFPSTGSNDKWGTVILDLELKRGRNRILFKTIEKDESIHLDFIGIKK